MRAALAMLACATACGDNLAGNAPCVATFSGNFADETSSAGACAQLAPASESADQLLSFTVDSAALGAQMVVSIDLGPAPASGRYSSETLSAWHVVEAKSIGDDGACVYSAGDEIVPNGSFTLSLAAIDPATAHGTLDVLQYVHAVDGTDCGPANTETVAIVF